MNEILLLNARRKRRTKTTKRKRPVGRAKRLTTKRRSVRSNTQKRATQRVAAKKGFSIMPKRRRKRSVKGAPRRNPSRTRRLGRAMSNRASGAIMGLQFGTALKNVPLATLGMLAAKWLAKRGGAGASHTDPETWDYAAYLKGAAGAAAAGIIANMLKRGAGQKVLEGGMALMLYQLIQNELVVKSEWATNQFGADQTYEPGDVEANSEGQPYILGEDYQWHPLGQGDDYRMLPSDYMSDALSPVGPLGLGDALSPVGPLGQEDAWRRSFLNR